MADRPASSAGKSYVDAAVAPPLPVFSFPWEGQFSSVLVAGSVYYAAVAVTGPCSITGISTYVDSVFSGNAKGLLYDPNGNLLATGTATALVGTFRRLLLPFAAPVAVVRGAYIIGMVPDNATATFGKVNPIGGGTGISAGGSYASPPATVTPQTTAQSAQIPALSTY